MINRTLGVVAAIVAATSIGFASGALWSQSQNDARLYDDIHNDLTAFLMVSDAIANDRGKRAVPLVLSMLSADFLRMVELHGQGQPETSELVRCAVTRKIRVLKDQKQIFSGPSAVDDWGSNIAVIEKYLNSECQGPPSHTDWSREEQKESR